MDRLAVRADVRAIGQTFKGMQLGAAFILIKSHAGYARKAGCSRDEAMLTRQPIRNSAMSHS